MFAHKKAGYSRLSVNDNDKNSHDFYELLAMKFSHEKFQIVPIKQSFSKEYIIHNTKQDLILNLNLTVGLKIVALKDVESLLMYK